MIDFDLYGFYKHNSDNKVLLSFKGAWSQEILVEIGELVRNKFSIDKKIKKIFNVFVELAQNIMHYSAEREIVNKKDVGVGIIVFIESKEYFHVFSGNMIKNSSSVGLVQRFEEINRLNEEELKRLHGEQIRQPKKPESCGAGLGLIDIARKSMDKLIYGIEYINDEDSFLTIHFKIQKGE